MAYSNISYMLAPENMQQIRSAIDQINSLMPFLVTLSAEEKKGLVKLGPKSADFVADALLRQRLSRLSCLRVSTR